LETKDVAGKKGSSSRKESRDLKDACLREGRGKSKASENLSPEKREITPAGKKRRFSPIERGAHGEAGKKKGTLLSLS